LNTQPVVGISTEDHKLASLLFEKIIPLNSASDIPNILRYPFNSKDPNYRKIRDTDGKKTVSKILLKIIQDFRESGTVPEDTVQNFLDENENIAAKNIHDFLKKKDVFSIPIFHTQMAYDTYLPNGTKETLEINLMKAPVIDTSKVEWEQILDIRKDKDFSNKLRNFRLFLNENYEGKSPNFVRDSLEKKMEEYEDACKMHGLQLVLSSISQTLDSKSILGYLGLITVGILAGQQNIVNAALLGGIIVEIGKVTVQVTQKHLEYLSSRENKELAYLIKLKKTFE
jgi:hypothetical protein